MTKLLTPPVKYGRGRPRKGEVRPKKKKRLTRPRLDDKLSEIDWTHTVAEPQVDFKKPTWKIPGYIHKGEQIRWPCHIPKDVMAVLYAMKDQLRKDHALLKIKTVTNEPLKPSVAMLVALAVQEFAERGLPNHAKVREPRKWRTELSPTEAGETTGPYPPLED